jgi:hypothetical protein
MHVERPPSEVTWQPLRQWVTLEARGVIVLAAQTLAAINVDVSEARNAAHEALVHSGDAAKAPPVIAFKVENAAKPLVPLQRGRDANRSTDGAIGVAKTSDVK